MSKLQYQTIRSPHLTEKVSDLMQKSNQYAFKVDINSTKREIKKAVEDKFKVNVKKVATMNFKGKNKNMTIRSNGHVLRTNGNRSSWKKAIVTLEKGSTIDILTGDV